MLQRHLISLHGDKSFEPSSLNDSLRHTNLLVCFASHLSRSASCSNCSMQRQPPIADACSPDVPPQAVQVTVRNSRGDGSRLFVIDVASSGTVADVKRLLCLPPYSVVSDASALELVLEG